jgi:hypothetical protein
MINILLKNEYKNKIAFSYFDIRYKNAGFAFAEQILAYLCR